MRHRPLLDCKRRDGKFSTRRFVFSKNKESTNELPVTSSTSPVTRHLSPP